MATMSTNFTLSSFPPILNHSPYLNFSENSSITTYLTNDHSTVSIVWILLYMINIVAIIISNFILIHVILLKVLYRRHNDPKLLADDSLRSMTTSFTTLSPTSLVSQSDSPRSRIFTPSPPIPVRRTLSKDVRNMNMYIVFLSSADFLVGAICLPLYVIFNYPTIFFAAKGHTGEIAYTCWVQTFFTFFSGYCGFASAYAITALALNRYRAVSGINSNTKFTFSFRKHPIKTIIKMVRKSQKGCYQTLWLDKSQFWRTYEKIILLFSLTVLSTIPLIIIMIKTHCSLHEKFMGHEWNTIILIYTTLFGLLIPVVIAVTAYVASIKALQKASEQSAKVLGATSSVEHNSKAIHMIISIMMLHLIVGAPTTIINFLEIFQIINPYSGIWTKYYITELSNLLMSIDRWGNVIVIFYFGHNLKKALQETYHPCLTWCANLKNTLQGYRPCVGTPMKMEQLSNNFDCNLYFIANPAQINLHTKYLHITIHKHN